VANKPSELHGVSYTELAESSLAMDLDRPHGDSQLFGDLLIWVSGRDKPHHLALARSEGRDFNWLSCLIRRHSIRAVYLRGLAVLGDLEVGLELEKVKHFRVVPWDKLDPLVPTRPRPRQLPRREQIAH
jgi:hypothetical protein